MKRRQAVLVVLFGLLVANGFYVGSRTSLSSNDPISEVVRALEEEYGFSFRLESAVANAQNDDEHAAVYAELISEIEEDVANGRLDSNLAEVYVNQLNEFYDEYALLSA